MRVTNITSFYAEERPAYIVRIDTDEGIFGHGECSPMHVGGILQLMRDRAASLVVGADPLQITMLEEKFLKQNYKIAGQLPAMTWSGIDQALWDIRAKAAGQSVQASLGGSVRDSVPYYGSSMSRHLSPEQEAEKILAAVALHGFRAVKIKIGKRMAEAPGMPDFRADALKVRRIREAIGPDIQIFVDGNSAYTAAQALQVWDRIREYDVALFEEPCPFQDLEAYAALAGRLPVPVNVGEQDWSLYTVRDFLLRGGCQHVGLDVTKCGGFSNAVRVATLCRAFGVQYVPHDTSRGIGFTATHHLAICLPECSGYQEYSIENPDSRDRYVLNRLIPMNGVVEKASGVGIGVEMDEERMRREMQVVSHLPGA